MVCKHCGEEIADDSMFCEFCGKNVDDNKHVLKKVDIRWCLLPAMILSSIIMSLFGGYDDFINWGFWDHVFPFFIPVVVLFVVAVFCWLKKTLQPSFMILIFVFLLTNTWKIYLVMNPVDFYKLSTNISWLDDNNSESITLESMYNYYYNDIEGAKTQLTEIENVVRKDLEAKGLTVIENNDLRLREVHQYYTNFAVVIYVEIITLLIYLIYVFIAYKKELNF